MTKSIIEFILVFVLLAIASFYGKQGALLPVIWWIIALVVLGFRVSDLLRRKGK